VVELSDHYYTSKPTSKLEKGLIKTRLRGREYTFVSGSGVFSFKRIDNGTRTLVEAMELPDEGSVHDLGCGYGVIGIVAATICPKLQITLTDINSRATSLAKENVARMGLTNVMVSTGDLYEPVREREFNVIVCNPPVSAGMTRTVKPIVEGAADHLVEGGSLQLVIQWNKGGRILAGYLEECFGGFEVLARRGGFRVFKSIFK
jgi:16S rRNA (guanine1207-N2)-methyltransferase